MLIHEHLLFGERFCRTLDPGFRPKATGGGGIILMKGASLQEVEAYFDKDPVKVAGAQKR